MKQESEIERIQKVMNKYDKSETDLNYAHFDMDNKCSAILNFMETNSIEFNTAFVDSVHEQFLRRGYSSESQIRAIDNIISKYSIDVNRWYL